MKDNFTFDDKTHTYRLDGKRLSGVTTILGVISKGNALVNWAARMSSEYVLENLKDLDDLEQVCEDAKTAHTKKRDDAATKGTDVHKEIEGLVKDVIEIELFNGFFGEKLQHKEKQVQHFIDWAVKNKVKFLVSERKVYSKKLFVAGTYDFKCEIDGKTYMGDIKTTSGIYGREPFAQCAAYQHFEKEMTGKDDVDGRLIINLKKTGQFDEESDVYYSYDYDTDLEIFMSALTLYRKLSTFKRPNYKFRK